jgi:hypothetical protein
MRNAKPETSEKMKKVAAAYKIKKTIKELKQEAGRKFFLLLNSTFEFFLKFFRLEGFPRSLNYDEIRNELLNLNDVIKIHDLRIW